MFGFMGMMNDYEDRKIDRFESGEDFFISTVSVNDNTRHPFETAVCHPNYNGGNIVIVEEYDSKDDAQEGHDKWVEIMTAAELPQELKDVSSCDIAEFVNNL